MRASIAQASATIAALVLLVFAWNTLNGHEVIQQFLKNPKPQQVDPIAGEGPYPLLIEPDRHHDKSPGLAAGDSETTTGQTFEPLQLDSFIELNKVGLIAGSLTRAEVGPEYDECIRRLAFRNVQNNVRTSYHLRAAKFCGFKSWSELEEALHAEDPDSVSLRSMLSDLVDRSLRASERVDHLLEFCWMDPDRVDAWDPREPHDVRGWMADRGITRDSGLLRFSASTSIGDRSFMMHFCSADFPTLEFELQTIQQLRRAYWQASREASSTRK